MYPEGYLVNNLKKNLIIFEKDTNNPLNEGYISFWTFEKINCKQLIFKKRISKSQAIAQWEAHIKAGWQKTTLLKKAA